MRSERKILSAGGALSLAVGLVFVGATAANAASVQPFKSETCHNSNFVHLYASSGTRCYADDGYNNVSISGPEDVSGGNNYGYVYETDGDTYFFYADGSTEYGLNPSATATGVEIEGQN